MKIDKYFGIDGAGLSKGLTIIIDVFRAASVAAFLLEKKIQYIIPVSTKEEALLYKSKGNGYILVGEDRGYKIPEFDIGNSPFEILKKQLNGKIIIHRSSMGTQGLINAINATEIIFGSFVCTNAIIQYIKRVSPDELSIVALDGMSSADDYFADFLISKLNSTKEASFKRIVHNLKSHPEATKFLDSGDLDFHKEDFDLCLDLDRFNFFPYIKKEDGLIKIVKGS